MNLSRLSALLILWSAFALAACGNKADLFMPPPPEDDEVIDTWDGEESFEEEESLDDDPELPLPVPTGDE